jgi:DNA-binding transcriptional LysR family regulator
LVNLHRLRLLREFSLRGTVGEVATALMYSPSTVSQQLSTLESELGATLLEQVGRRLKLTRQGEILVAHADRILQAVEEAQASLSASAHAVAGTVRLACFQTAALAVLPGVVTRLQGDHPLLRIQVSEFAPDRMISALQAHDFDVVLGEEYPGRSVERHPSIDIEQVATDRLCVTSGPEQLGPARSLADLADSDWVMEPTGNAARHWTVQQCRDAGFEPRVAFESADLLVHVRLVEAGLAAAFLPDLVWSERSPAVARWAVGTHAARRIFIASRHGAIGDPALAAVKDALAAGVRGAVRRAEPPTGVLAALR